MTRRRLGDDVLVSRAARQVALPVAALVALAMMLLVALVTIVVVTGQARAADNLLRTTAATADDVADPPPGTWLVIARGDELQVSPGLPAQAAAALQRARATAPARLAIMNTGDDGARQFRVGTRAFPGRTVQVVLDLTSEQRQRTRLLQAMGAASLVALVFAAGLGVLIGRRAVRPMAAALALQRTFVADASHELRTPLTLLSTRAQLLDRELQAGILSDQVRADSAGVLADVMRIGDVLEDLLVAADPRGQDPADQVDVNAVVTAAVSSARAHAEQSEVTLIATTEPSEGSLPHHVLGAPVSLRRAVLALIDNAIDHTPAGGTVTVTTGDRRGMVTVAVSDTGPGVAADQARHVLQRFHSGGQRAGRTHYGLGLALTHDVANRHGGELRLVPSQTGATFELSLPRLD